MENKYYFITIGDYLIKINPLTGEAWKSRISNYESMWKKIKEINTDPEILNEGKQ